MLRKFMFRAQLAVAIAFLMELAFMFGHIAPQPVYSYPIARQPVQMIGKVAVTTDAKLLTRAAVITICGKGQLPGCPVKHGRKS